MSTNINCGVYNNKNYIYQVIKVIKSCKQNLLSFIANFPVKHNITNRFLVEVFVRRAANFFLLALFYFFCSVKVSPPFLVYSEPVF